MKYIKKISFSLLMCAAFLTSCDDKEDTFIKGLNIDKTEITAGEDGGIEKINIQSDTEWTAVSDQPWVNISPASGIGSSVCIVSIDSTLINDIRVADIKISSEAGHRQSIKVNQLGYGKIISVNTEEVNLKSFATVDKRYFDVSVTTNTLFNINIPESEGWVYYDNKQLEVDLDKGARPRTVKIRFNWNMNPENNERFAKVEFTPIEGEIEKEASFSITQEAAPIIEDNIAGDSLALIIIQQKMACYAEYNTGEAISNWAGVQVWKKTDKPENPDMIGRVRRVDFFIYDLNEEFPSEIEKLTYLETFTVVGNMNGFRKRLNVGDAFSNLKYLKHLSLFGHGLNKLDESLTNIKQLESLDLSGNTFSYIPEILTPENFPSLTLLDLGANRCDIGIIDLSTLNDKSDIGIYMHLDKKEDDKQRLVKLFSWEKLEHLTLSVNFIEGNIPDMEDFPIRYTAEEVNANDTLPQMMIGTPKILPNAKLFMLNLNMLTGSIPNWILYHPYLWNWDAYTLIFNQEGFNSDGKAAGFDNIPINMEYYYEQYPLRRPTIND